jgi:hypothetical protein
MVYTPIRLIGFKELLHQAAAEADRREARRRQPKPGGIAKQQLRPGIIEDAGDGRGREPMIDRHGNEAGAHDAVICSDEFRAVGREDRDPVAAREPVPGKRAGGAVRHAVEVRESKAALAAFAAKIDYGELFGIAVAPDEIAEIAESGHAFRRLRVTPLGAR